MANEERYSLNELTEAAGVSARTVRYYIAEGLLPPPMIAGARSYYTREHLDRLHYVDVMKSHFMPLREIRKRMTGMTAPAMQQEMAELLQGAEDETFVEIAGPISAVKEESAANYLDRIIHRSANQPQGAASSRTAPRPQLNRRLPVAGQRYQMPAADAESANWRRLAISEDAELLISEDAYQRNQERIDWLIDWARKVLGS